MRIMEPVSGFLELWTGIYEIFKFEFEFKPNKIEKGISIRHCASRPKPRARPRNAADLICLARPLCQRGLVRHGPRQCEADPQGAHNARHSTQSACRAALVAWSVANTRWLDLRKVFTESLLEPRCTSRARARALASDKEGGDVGTAAHRQGHDTPVRKVEVTRLGEDLWGRAVLCDLQGGEVR
jgi:hypothetical protein